ncbi:hypothetical protein HDV02_005735 [Globomyces sp. JEL0801]|nr:hypothetical protein HDV02_005735 [Globomyces sp. JEL0801]
MANHISSASETNDGPNSQNIFNGASNPNYPMLNLAEVNGLISESVSPVKRHKRKGKSKKQAPKTISESIADPSTIDISNNDIIDDNDCLSELSSTEDGSGHKQSQNRLITSDLNLFDEQERRRIHEKFLHACFEKYAMQQRTKRLAKKAKRSQNVVKFINPVSYKDRFIEREKPKNFDELFAKFSNNRFINAAVRRNLWAYWRKGSIYNKELNNIGLEKDLNIQHVYDHRIFKPLFSNDCQVSVDILFHKLSGLLYTDQVNRKCFLNLLTVLDDLAFLRNEDGLPRHAPSNDDDIGQMQESVIVDTNNDTGTDEDIDLDELERDLKQFIDILPKDIDSLSDRFVEVYGDKDEIKYHNFSHHHLEQLLNRLQFGEINYDNSVIVLECLRRLVNSLPYLSMRRKDEYTAKMEEIHENDFMDKNLINNLVRSLTKVLEPNFMKETVPTGPTPKIPQKVLRAPKKNADLLKSIINTDSKKSPSKRRSSVPKSTPAAKKYSIEELDSQKSSKISRQKLAATLSSLWDNESDELEDFDNGKPAKKALQKSAVLENSDFINTSKNAGEESIALFLNI